MCVWLFSRPSWRNIDRDRCKRAETHTDDLKSNEVADTFHQLGPLQPTAIHADESKFLSQLLHNGLCLRVVRAEKDRDPSPHQFIAIEFNDLSRHCVESLTTRAPGASAASSSAWEGIGVVK